MAEKNINMDSKEKSISESIEDQFDDLFAPKKPDDVPVTGGKTSVQAIPPVNKFLEKIPPQKPSRVIVTEHKSIVNAPVPKKESSAQDTPPAKVAPNKFSPNKTLITKKTQTAHLPENKPPVKQDTPIIKEEVSSDKDTNEPVVQNVFKKANQEYKKNIIWEKIRESLNPIIFTLLLLLLVVLSMFIGKVLIPDEMMAFLNNKKTSAPVIETVSRRYTEKKIVNVTKEITNSSANTAVIEPEIEKAPVQETSVKKEEVKSHAGTDTVLSAETADKPIDIIKEKKLFYPYSIYLGSYSSIEKVKKASLDYLETGISSYWIRLDLGEKGVWFRLFTGYFQTREDADKFIKARQLKDAESRLTKYTNFLGFYTYKEDADRQKANLEGFGYSPYIIDEGNNTYRLYAGAFYQKDRAEELKKDLELKGIKSEIMER